MPSFIDFHTRMHTQHQARPCDVVCLRSKHFRSIAGMTARHEDPRDRSRPSWNMKHFRCSRVRVRRVVVPKNIQPARTKCSWTTTLTGKISSFGLDPRRSSNFSFWFEHSDSVWLRVPRPWPGMPRSANLAGATNCCWIQPTLYLKWRPRREWRDTNRMGFFDHRSLSKRLQTWLPLRLKLPQMWRHLMRVEKRLMVLSLVPEPTRRNIQHLKDLSLSCLQSVFFDFRTLAVSWSTRYASAQRAELRDSCTACARVETSKACVPR